MYTAAIQKELYIQSKSIIEENFVPTAENAEQRLSMIYAVIRYHEWRYYVLNDPILSDFEYDTLFKKAEYLELNFPQYIAKDAPTQRVSSDIVNEASNVAHLVPMLSLANSYNAEDLYDFDKSVKKILRIPEGEEVSYCVEPKYDGGSIALIYENNQLVRGATRGNGTVGEEMTHNARVIKSIPLSASFSELGVHKVELRGEVLIRKDIFEKINQKRIDEGEQAFANPRNAATGGLRMKDPNETAQRGLDAFIYQLGYAVDDNGQDVLNQFETHDQTINYLSSLGFKVPIAERKQCKNIEEAISFCTEWDRKRENYAFEIDGMVVKVNERKYYAEMGSTAHHPRWAIAYKFKAKQATTTLLDVEYQIGKIGAITPVAKLKPVQLAGVTVSSVSLHNEAFIKDRDLKLGDQVLVERAGDVIPYIVKANVDLRDGSEKDIHFPTTCPSCDTVLLQVEDEAAWRCVNIHCEAQVIQKMIFLVSKTAMDIDGMGESNIRKFYADGLIKDLADIYNLDYEAIEKMDGFGKKSIEKMRKNINLAKKKPLQKILHSLSIHHLGKRASQLIAENITNIWDLKQKTIEDLTAIKDIGPVVAKNTIDFFATPENIQLLEKMEAFGVDMSQKESDKKKETITVGPFVGKSILFTGKLMKTNRNEAKALAEAAGARNLSAVSAQLDILVVGEKAGSKLKKATALGTVQIMTEGEFLELVRG